MTILELISYAESNAHKASMKSSADFCILQAKKAHSIFDMHGAKVWALKSIAYSCGIFNPIYISNK